MEEKEVVKTEEKEVVTVEESVVTESTVTKKKKSKLWIFIVILFIAIALLAGAIVAVVTFKFPSEKPTGDVPGVAVSENYLDYKIVDNSLGDFDIRFLQTDNDRENKVYSPLSIKYALTMLNEGAAGETKKQIETIIGDYKPKAYTNSDNMSLANALFVRDSSKDKIKDTYIDSLATKYNASLIYDPFNNPDNINDWVSDKTFGMVEELLDDVGSDTDYVLVNALAIDMEWVKKIQPEMGAYRVKYAHRDFGVWVDDLVNGGYPSINFNNNNKDTKAVQFAAVANRYDIVADLGEQNIIDTVSADYTNWLKEDPCQSAATSPSVSEYIPKYMSEIKEGYGDISSSTDFSFYVDDNVKVFSKDLREYDGTTLQYVGIMPKQDNLDTYVSNVKASEINTLIDSLKPIELNSFKDGVITQVEGTIPLFEFEYELDLMKNLKMLGIQDVFDDKKADLSNLTKDVSYIGKAAHKANIEFSNDGIKAGAATAMGGSGAAGCWYDYLFEVPVEKIDLTFDKPYLFFVIDKDTREVWFTGTVYEPKESNPSEDYIWEE